MKAIIAIGSNMGDRREYIKKAIDLMGERAGNVTAVSDIIETKAYGYTDQDDFLNLAVALETRFEPEELLGILNEIEARLDRKREIRWGPRTIDLDIVFYGDRIVDTDKLHIPHVDMYNREFVLGPVCQIAPDLIDPRTGRSVSELLTELRERQ